MSVMLAEPPGNFRSLSVASKTVDPTTLFRLTRHASGEPYFGRSGSFRFDDPLKKYGTCYCGFNVQTAIAETVLHDEDPVDGCFRIPESKFTERFVVRFQGVPGKTLQLADLTGIALKRLGGTGALSTILPYTLPQMWSRAVFSHPANFDGIHYMSRHLNNRAAVVLFGARAERKMGRAIYIPLPKISNIGRIRRQLGIVFV